MNSDLAQIKYQLHLLMPVQLEYKLDRCQKEAIVKYCLEFGVFKFHTSKLWKKIKANPADPKIRPLWPTKELADLYFTILDEKSI